MTVTQEGKWDSKKKNEILSSKVSRSLSALDKIQTQFWDSKDVESFDCKVTLGN